MYTCCGHIVLHWVKCVQLLWIFSNCNMLTKTAGYRQILCSRELGKASLKLLKLIISKHRNIMGRGGKQSKIRFELGCSQIRMERQETGIFSLNLEVSRLTLLLKTMLPAKEFKNLHSECFLMLVWGNYSIQYNEIFLCSQNKPAR